MRMMRVSGFGFKGWFLTDFELQRMHVSGDPIAAAGDALLLQTEG